MATRDSHVDILEIPGWCQDIVGQAEQPVQWTPQLREQWSALPESDWILPTALAVPDTHLAYDLKVPLPGCPAILGINNTIFSVSTDFPTDLIDTQSISSWLRTATEANRFWTAGATESPFRRMQTAGDLAGIAITIAPDTQISEPLDIGLIHTGAGRSQGRLVVHIGKNSQCTISIRNRMARAANSLQNLVVDVFLDEGASVEWVHGIDGSDDAMTVITTTAIVSKHATWDATWIHTNPPGKLRNEAVVTIAGEGACATLRALSIASKKSRISHNIIANHPVGQNESHQCIKSIISDQATVEYAGLVSIAPNAQLANTTQLNRALLVSNQARAISRPQLRIDANDVKCSHGATCGQLESDELFYLESRGFSPAEARTCLIHGFAQDIIDTIQSPILRTFWQSELKNRLTHLTISDDAIAPSSHDLTPNPGEG